MAFSNKDGIVAKSSYAVDRTHSDADEISLVEKNVMGTKEMHRR
jgi:hypothetical protein